jgi:hypothetical protein
MPKKQQQEKSLSSFYFRFLQPGDAIIRFLESAVTIRTRLIQENDLGGSGL